MNKGWLKGLMISVLALGTIWFSRADGWILFQNNVGATIVPIFGGDGTTKIGQPYKAQLFLQINGDWVSVSKAASIGNNGRFGGGTVIIPGDYGGKAVTFTVRIWDGSAYSTYDQASRAGTVVQSPPFTETLASPPDEPAQPMLHFKSFSACGGHVSAIVGQFFTQEGEPTPISFFLTPKTEEVCPGTIDAAFLNDQTKFSAYQIPGYLPGLSLGKVRGVFDPDHKREGRPFTYVPNTNVYGTDLIFFVQCWVCQDFNAYDAVSVTIAPSEARQRPTLFLPVPKKPALLGLSGHHYRIDRSTDLNTWEPAGTVTGNYSTVDLSSFVTAGASAHFLRATDVTTP